MRTKKVSVTPGISTSDYRHRSQKINGSIRRRIHNNNNTSRYNNNNPPQPKRWIRNRIRDNNNNPYTPPTQRGFFCLSVKAVSMPERPAGFFLPALPAQ